MTYFEIFRFLFAIIVLPIVGVGIVAVISIRHASRKIKPPRNFPSREALMLEIKQLEDEKHQLKRENNILLNENRRLRHDIQRERSAPRE